jgi:hypothetical protein
VPPADYQFPRASDGGKIKFEAAEVPSQAVFGQLSNRVQLCPVGTGHAFPNKINALIAVSGVSGLM